MRGTKARRHGGTKGLVSFAAAALTLAGCRAAPRPDAGAAPGFSATYAEAAVASDHAVASAAGAEILERGGNAVDAAVATSFALSVVRPYSCGLGGGGFMIVHRPARDGVEAMSAALNYRETAPAGMDPSYFSRLEAAGGPPVASRFGGHAVGVPGTVAGLLDALERWGTLDRATVLEPAIRAAEDGFPADANFLVAMEELEDKAVAHPHVRPLVERLREHMGLAGPLRLGATIRNPGQARALRLIAERGRSGFYEGRVAASMVAAVRAGGGVLSCDDLRNYRPDLLVPLRGALGDRTVLAMPPPSSGGIATLQVLGLLDRRADDLAVLKHNDPAYVHLVTEALKHAFADRAQWLADPRFAPVPIEALLDAAALDRTAAGIDTTRTGAPGDYGTYAPPPDDAGTSHLCVIDRDGMAVACTETINLVFGSLVAVPCFGFVLNDEIDDFTTIPGAANAFGLRQSDWNLPEPGKRPLSSMTPTIVLEGGEAIAVAGGAGGPRIITGTIQTLVNALHFDMDAGTAVSASRFHHQWRPDVLQFEEDWAGAAVPADLEALGHEVGRRQNVGKVQIIRVAGDGIEAACDPRKGGRPAGR